MNAWVLAFSKLINSVDTCDHKRIWSKISDVHIKTAAQEETREGFTMKVHDLLIDLHWLNVFLFCFFFNQKLAMQ